MSSEIFDYLMKADKRLKAAKKLLSLGMYEDAVSRAYYSVLNAAKAALASQEIYPKTHEGALKTFGETFIKGKRMPRALGVSFSRMKTLREKADYSPKIETTKEDAEWSIKSAEQFLEEVKNAITPLS